MAEPYICADTDTKAYHKVEFRELEVCPTCGLALMVGSCEERFEDVTNSDQQFVADVEIRTCVSCEWSVVLVEVASYLGY